jgi:hypothetical protein
MFSRVSEVVTVLLLSAFAVGRFAWGTSERW